MIPSKNIVQRIGVIGIIENERGEILITQRFDPQIPKAHLKWDVQGGKNETGKSLEETLIREIQEETGLEVEVLKQLGKPMLTIWEHQDYLLKIKLYCYHCRFLKGKLHPWK